MRLVAIVSNVLLARVRILLYKWKANWSSFDFLDRLDRKTFIQKMTWLRGISRWMKANRRNLHTRSRKLRKICHFHVDRFIFMLSISLIFSSSKVIREKPASIIFNDFKINNVVSLRVWLELQEFQDILLAVQIFKNIKSKDSKKKKENRFLKNRRSSSVTFFSMFYPPLPFSSTRARELKYI